MISARPHEYVIGCGESIHAPTIGIISLAAQGRGILVPAGAA